MAHPGDSSEFWPEAGPSPRCISGQPFLPCPFLFLSSFPSFILLEVTAERDLREHHLERGYFINKDPEGERAREGGRQDTGV